MKLYEQAVMSDLVAPVRDWVDANIVSYEVATRMFKYNNPMAYAFAGPWILQRPAPDRICGKWFKIYWEKYDFMPKGCRGCWKVVVKISTLEELWKIYKLQQKLDLPSKCGLDRRTYTPAIYSSFWYAPMQQGLEGGRILWKKIRDAVHAEIGPHMKVLLKRGCTEMEGGLGPSDRWPEMSLKQKEFEDLLDSVWPDTPPQTPTPTLVRMHYFAKWIRWAWMHGDPTWKQFADTPLMRPVVEYQTSIHSAVDFPVPTYNRPIIGAEDEKRTEDPSGLEMGPDSGRPEEGIALV